MAIIEKDKAYRDLLKNEYKLLQKGYESLLDENIILSDNEITKAILLRVMEYYNAQNKIKELLDLKQKAPAAYFFANTILFFTKVYLESTKPELQVFGEKTIRRKRGSIKPDVSVWREDEVVAIIECKTQFGWSRHKWESDFLAREEKLKKEFPNAKAFLLVLTSINWDGFEGLEEKGRKYHVLANVWPSEIPESNLSNVIDDPFEGILKQIVED